MAVDLSTAMLALSENGDLQRIHDKWLKQSSCSGETSEIESDRLHLKSFWGLFLMCGLACFFALFIYFLQIIRQLYRAAPVESASPGHSSSRSSRLQKLLSLMDEKEDLSKSSNKKRRVERSLSDEGDHELERNPRRNELDMITGATST